MSWYHNSQNLESDSAFLVVGCVLRSSRNTFTLPLVLTWVISTSVNMFLYKFICVVISISFIQVYADLILPLCATNCVNNNSKAPPSRDTCTADDLPCLCLNTWWIDVYECASKSCNSDDATRADDWGRERCNSMYTSSTRDIS